MRRTLSPAPSLSGTPAVRTLTTVIALRKDLVGVRPLNDRCRWITGADGVVAVVAPAAALLQLLGGGGGTGACGRAFDRDEGRTARSALSCVDSIAASQAWIPQGHLESAMHSFAT